MSLGDDEDYAVLQRRFRDTIVRMQLVLSLVALSALVVPSVSPPPAPFFVALDQEPVAVEVRTTLPDGRAVESATIPGPDGEAMRHGPFRVFAAGSEDWLVSGAFDQGVRDGGWRYRYGAGEIAASGKFEAGERKGRWKFFWPDGSVAATGVFKDGAPAGKWTFNDPLDPKSKGRALTLTTVAGESDIDGASYSGFLAEGELIGWWTIVRADGSLLFEGAFDQFGVPRAATFRHAGGVPDTAFFDELRDTPHPHDFAFRSLDEYGDVTSVAKAAPSSVAEGLGSVSQLWESDGDYAKVSPIKLAAVSSQVKGPRPRAGESVRPLDPRPDSEVREELAGALKSLAALDWSQRTSMGAALGVVRGVVQPALGYFDLGFQVSSGSPAPESNGLAVLRAHWLVTAGRYDRDFWLIDAAARTIAPGEGLQGAQVTGLDPRHWLSKADRKTAMGKQSKSSSKRARPKKRSDGKQSAATVTAIADGIAWLLSAQQPDGSWLAGTSSFDEAEGVKRHGESLGHNVGATSFAVLALVRNPGTAQDPERLDAVRRGLRFILDCRQTKVGRICNYYESVNAKNVARTNYSLAWIYDHALAVQAFAEAQSMVRSGRIRLGLAEGVEVLGRAKDPKGGWRYFVPTSHDTDTSVTFFVMRALLAARQVGYTTDVDPAETVSMLLNELTDEGTGRTGYSERGSPSARQPGLNQQHFPTDGLETLTAEALALRKWLGQENDATVRTSADLLLRSLPRWNEDGSSADFCYWLGGTEAMVQIGDQYEKVWSKAMLSALLDHQCHSRKGLDAGSWDPTGPWGMVGGRTYATASAVMALQLL